MCWGSSFDYYFIIQFINLNSMNKKNNIQVKNTCKGVTLQNKRCRINLPEGVFFCEHHKKQEGNPLDISSRKTCAAINIDGSSCGNALSSKYYKFCFYHRNEIPLKDSNKVYPVVGVFDENSNKDYHKCAAIDIRGKMCGLPHDSSFLFCRDHKDFVPGSNDDLIPKLNPAELASRYEALPAVIEFRDKEHFKNNNTFLSLNTLDERINYLRHIDRVNLDKYNRILCKLKGCINRTGEGFEYCFAHKEYSSIGKYVKLNTPKACKGITVKGVACKKILSSDSPDDYCNWHINQKPPIAPATLMKSNDYSSVSADYCKDGLHKFCKGLNSFGVRCKKTILISDPTNYCGWHRDQASHVSAEDGPSLRSIRENLPPFDHSWSLEKKRDY